MTSLENKLIFYCHPMTNNWLVYCSSSENKSCFGTIDCSGSFYLICQKDNEKTMLYDCVNKEFAIGTWNYPWVDSFDPIWREFPAETKRQTPKWEHYDGGGVSCRWQDQLVMTTHYLDELCKYKNFLTKKVFDKIKSSFSKDRNVLFFIDLNSAESVNMICPTELSANFLQGASFSQDGQTVLAYGQDGYVVIDNPLL